MASVDFVRQGPFMLLQFNTTCEEARPVCRAMCCRMRQHYSVPLTEEEAGRLFHTVIDGVRFLDGLPSGDCVYLDTEGKCSIYETRPQACREWHCSPQGALDDPEIVKRENGWVLFPAREAK